MDKIFEEIVDAISSNGELQNIILKNPTRKELSDNDMDKSRGVKSQQGDLYFINALDDKVHYMLTQELEKKKIADKFTSGPYLYFYYDNERNIFYFYTPESDLERCTNIMKESPYMKNFEGCSFDYTTDPEFDILTENFSSKPILYIIRGVPGSGKTTLAHKLSPLVVEADDYMTTNGRYVFNPKKLKYCHQMCQLQVEEYMEQKQPVIAVSNTFIKRWEFQPYLDLCKKYGYQPMIKICNGNYENVHNVPKEKVEKMKQNFEESKNSLNEMASAGATCCACVGTVSKPIGDYASRIKQRVKDKKKKEKAKQTNESFDVILFKNLMESQCPTTCTINGQKLEYKVIDGKDCLYVNGELVESNEKKVLNSIVESAINEDINLIKPTTSTGDSLTQKTPEEQQHTEELKKMTGEKDLAISDLDTNEITDKQELLGYDEKQDDFVVRDQNSGKVRVVKSNQISKMKPVGAI